MKMTEKSRQIAETTKQLRPRLISTIQELVQIPSENKPPTGYEFKCQEYLFQRLSRLGLQTEMYELSEVPKLTEHPAFRHQRDYSNRPNVAGVLKGTGGGKSLLLSGHIDTVPRGTDDWEFDPFAGQVVGNRLYGLGSNDMKGGIAAALVAIEAILEVGLNLRGDVIFETVVDEEFGGVNGTLAARLKGYNADAAIVTEPSQGVISPSQTGGRIAHITFRAEDGGILETGKTISRATDQLQYFLNVLPSFADQRKQSAPIHSLYQTSSDPVPVWVLKINAGGWGNEVAMRIPQTCHVELYWQLMPGEEIETIDHEFFMWLEMIISKRPDLFSIKPEVTFPIECLPGSAIEATQPIVTQLAQTFHEVTGSLPQIQGFGAPCDMFVMHQHFQMPALLFGPVGGNTHQPNEWVDLDSAQMVMETLAQFICRWCEVSD